MHKPNQISQINIQKILFLDIETVPQHESYNELPVNIKKLWDKKTEQLHLDRSAQENYQRAGIYAEFGKIVCISFGYIHQTDTEKQIRIKSVASKNEKELLQEFSSILGMHFNKPGYRLCAHNGKEFDFPYIARRCLINGLAVPSILDTRGKKPWETHHLDTLELWRFGDYKHYTSLELLTAIFDIPTPKDDIDGSMVGDIYWKEKDLDRIVQYCQKDVVAIIHLFCRYTNTELTNNIIFL